MTGSNVDDAGKKGIDVSVGRVVVANNDEVDSADNVVLETEFNDVVPSRVGIIVSGEDTDDVSIDV